jgi:hypothetical protein
MMPARFEYIYSPGSFRMPVRLPLDSSSADIKVGMAITSADATSGYYKEVDAAEVTVGIAMEDVDAPAADGGASVLVDISADSYYRASPDAGTVTAALRFKTADIGDNGSTVNIDASAVDNVRIHDVDTDTNTLKVSFTMATYAGVA